MKQTDEILIKMAETFRKRNIVYGDNYMRVGAIMKILFPDGVTLCTPNDFNRWHLFELMIVKLTRFSNTGLMNKDSIHDLAVYAAMVESTIEENCVPIKESEDTKRIDAIVNGYSVGCDINISGGIVTWLCIHNGQVAKAETIRAAIDKAIGGQFDE